MDCEAKDKCANYNGECTGDDYCLCEDYAEMTEDQVLWNTLHKTIDKMRERNQEELIRRVEQYEKREEELYDKIAELKRQIPNVDQLRKECLQDVRKEVFGEFLPGSKAFVYGLKTEYIPCTYCDGSGVITITHGGKSDEKECTKCYGKKTEGKRTPIVEQKTVRSIQLWIVDDGWGKQRSNGKIFFSDNDYDSEELNKVFATAEECQAYVGSLEKKP